MYQPGFGKEAKPFRSYIILKCVALKRDQGDTDDS